jgi:pimeloyl-ACP methyl ester carboxylesterase/anti-sigma regulatory factor (Ser/Thr protein kinase)
MSTPRTLQAPPGVRRIWVHAARTRFAALEIQPAADTGALPIVLVPGWTGSKEDFLAVLAPLAERGHPCLSIDQRGQFQTPHSLQPLPSGIDPYSVLAMGGDVLAVARAWRPDAPAFHLVGHSYGGLVVRASALTDGSMVASLTLLCSGPAALPAERHPRLKLMARAIRLSGLAATWWLKSMLDESASYDEQTPPEVLAWLRRRFLANDARSLRSITLNLTTELDRTAELADTGVAVSVIFGEHDDGWPTSTQIDMAKRLGVVPTVVAGAGHSPAVDEPVAVANTMADFMAQVETTLDVGPQDDNAQDGPGSPASERDDLPGQAAVEQVMQLHGSTAPGDARHLVAETLAALDPAPGEEARQDAALVTSELVTNAVEHGSGPVTLSVSVSAGHARVQVSSVSTGEPHVRPENGGGSGRGLAIVSTLASDWGWARDAGTVTVWADVALGQDDESGKGPTTD